MMMQPSVTVRRYNVTSVLIKTEVQVQVKFHTREITWTVLVQEGGAAAAGAIRHGSAGTTGVLHGVARGNIGRVSILGGEPTPGDARSPNGEVIESHQVTGKVCGAGGSPGKWREENRL